MKILVTGGCGYIGSHTCVELLSNGYDVVVIDNLSNSKKEALDNVEKITGKKVKFYLGDCCNLETLENIFEENKIDAVIHFAGFKAVGESVKNPIKYYENNLISTISLIKAMVKHNCKRLVFSSSATVYGRPNSLPVKENFSLSASNPYGETKLMIEKILEDLYKSDNEFSIAILRYFNPIGAHPSGLIGENPLDIPNNLMPYIVKVALGEIDHLNVFGNDYDTIDGTGVRDYIHVVDLAKGHLNAINLVLKETGIDYFNLGTGRGYSVLELLNTFMNVNDVDVKYCFTERRKGDIDSVYADVSYAKEKLNWQVSYGIEEMCKSAYQYALASKKSK